MPEKKPYLGEFEELLLMAIQRLGENAYGMPIRQLVAEATGRETSIGAVYTTLERMEQKGFISAYQGEPTPERGGRAKRYFRLEGAGVQALRDVQHAREMLQPRPQTAGGAV